MKPKTLGIFLLALAILAILLLLNALMRQASGTPAPQAPGAGASLKTCVPRPLDPTLGTVTKPKVGEAVMPQLLVTSTDLPISKTVDLAPEVPFEDKYSLIVMHCDGTFEQFWVKEGVSWDQANILKPDDVIIYDFPPESMMGVEPPYPPGWVTATPGTRSSLSSPTYLPTGVLSQSGTLFPYQSPTSLPAGVLYP